MSTPITLANLLQIGFQLSEDDIECFEYMYIVGHKAVYYQSTNGRFFIDFIADLSAFEGEQIHPRSIEEVQAHIAKLQQEWERKQ